MGSDIAVSVRGLSKSYTIAHQGERHVTLAESLLARARRPFGRAPKETFKALKDVCSDIYKGGIVNIGQIGTRYVISAIRLICVVGHASSTLPPTPAMSLTATLFSFQYTCG